MLLKTVSVFTGPLHSIVFTWKGPHGERHDFQSDFWHIESKATSRNVPIIRIHGHDQLAIPAGKHLLLFCFSASQESGAPDSIESEVEDIRVKLVSDPSAFAAFEESLMEAGWFPSEEPFRLRVRGADFYVVDDDFPSLGIADLPVGVIGVDWEIDLSHVPAADVEVWGAVLSEKGDEIG